MTCCFSKEIKSKVVSAIKAGLDDAQNAYNRPEMRIRNAIHFYKMDAIANEVIMSIGALDEFKIIEIKRGGYVLPLLIYIPDGTMVSIMSAGKFKSLLNRSDLAKTHYFDAFITINDKLNIDRNQLVLSEALLPVEDYEKKEIMRQVTEQLGGQFLAKYITITVEMKGLQLIGVESKLTSEYLEVFSTDDWSEFIELDYSDIEYIDSAVASKENDLGIKLKSNISRKGDISDKEIKPKVGSKENQA
jgi:hypothetical protein